VSHGGEGLPSSCEVRDASRTENTLDFRIYRSGCSRESQQRGDRLVAQIGENLGLLSVQTALALAALGDVESDGHAVDFLGVEQHPRHIA
jgi:hypothetical protein